MFLLFANPNKSKYFPAKIDAQTNKHPDTIRTKNTLIVVIATLSLVRNTFIMVHMKLYMCEKQP